MTISFYLHRDLINELKERANLENRSLSNLVYVLLKKALSE